MCHPHCIPDHGQNLGQNISLWHKGFGHHMWSHGHHVMIMQPCTTQATSLVGLGPEGSNPCSFPSFSILLQTDLHFVALQLLHTCLLSFLTWRLTVCTPVSCSCLCLLPPLVDSHHSYIYLPALCPDRICVQVTLWYQSL